MLDEAIQELFTEQVVATLSMILKSQSETLELKHEKYSKYLPYILIEQGEYINERNNSKRRYYHRKSNI